MKVTLNPDAEIVRTVKEGLKRTGGILSLPAGTNGGQQVYVQGVPGTDQRSGL